MDFDLPKEVTERREKLIATLGCRHFEGVMPKHPSHCGEQTLDGDQWHKEEQKQESGLVSS